MAVHIESVACVHQRLVVVVVVGGVATVGVVAVGCKARQSTGKQFGQGRDRFLAQVHAAG